MTTYLFTLSVEVDDADLPAGADGAPIGAEEAAAQVMMAGPLALVDVPEFLRHRIVVAAEARELHPHPEEVLRRVAELERRVAQLEGH